MAAQQRNRTVLASALAMLLLASAWPSALLGAPASNTPETAPSNQPFVTIEKGAVASPVDGTLKLRVTVAIDAETSYLESRLQLHRPTGRLIYQKTEIQHDVETGTVTFEYERALDDLDLKPGAYPIEVRVRSDSGEVREWIVPEELLVYDTEREPVPMVLLTRFGCALGSDPEGRFVNNPTATSRTRNEVDALSAYSVANADSSIGMLIAPVVLEEWRRVAEGYEYAGPEGLESVSSDSEVSQDHATTLSLLGTALQTGRLELLDVPYSDPDIVGLQVTGRLDDLGPQFERGLSAYFSAIESTPQPIAGTAEGYLPLGALAAVERRNAQAAIISTQSIAIDAEQSSGAVLAAGSDTVLLVVDDRASMALTSAEATSFARALFDWHLLSDEGAPIIVEVPLGAGSALTVAQLQECMAEVAKAPWIQIISPQEAAAAATGAVILRGELAVESDAPNGYWPEVADSRTKAQALGAATGASDPRAQVAGDASMLAQSRCWAGPDGSWSFADRGRAFAAAATRISDEVLDGVHIAAKDITLSGTRGEVPVSVVNQNEDDLTVTLKTVSDDLMVGDPETDIVTLRPSENLYSIPVDLGSSLSGTLRVQIWSDELLIDEQDVRVQASYLDRLAIIGGVTIVLVGMLLFIRRRVMRTSADTMDDES